MESPSASRAAVASEGLVAVASEHLTGEVAVHLPFEALGPFKTALKQFFSSRDWTAGDARALSDLVTPHLDHGWWEHDLGKGLTLRHGIADDGYRIEVMGRADSPPSIFDRAFAGPVLPEQTPHPRKVMFHVGGDPAPGVWHRRGEETDDERVETLMEDPDITDVMIAGDFVTIGLRRQASWEERLDDMLARVTELFWSGAPSSQPARTRDELLDEAGRLRPRATRAEHLHLMDPDDDEQRSVLVEALGSDDARRRRAAVVTLALSGDPSVAKAAIVTGYSDSARIVRRAAVDAAADLEDDEYRSLFEQAMFDEDAWTRWRSVRAIGDIGPGASRDSLVLAAADEDFRVRFEAASALKEEG
ncbi:MAG TPA: HEAT repeat domain-containing protein [Acidimicrobiia bacterium]|nr:HEAT repeat domain-containing protein [Acidimicrobiia bacterium]